jgi:hypothetical protein
MTTFRDGPILFSPASIAWHILHWAKTALPFAALPTKFCNIVPSSVVTSDAAKAAGFSATATCSGWLTEPSEQAATIAADIPNKAIAFAFSIFSSKILVQKTVWRRSMHFLLPHH